MEIDYSEKHLPLELHLAILGFEIETTVTKGENNGRTLRQNFTALIHKNYLSSQGRWSVSLSSLSVDVAERYGMALWVSRPHSAVPLQATGGWLPKEAISNKKDQKNKESGQR